MEGGWANNLSHSRPIRFVTVGLTRSRLPIRAKGRRLPPAAALWHLMFLLQKPIKDKTKQRCPPRKAYGAVCTLLNLPLEQQMPIYAKFFSRSRCLQRVMASSSSWGPFQKVDFVFWNLHFLIFLLSLLVPSPAVIFSV